MNHNKKYNNDIIIAIDLIDNKCVRLTKGNFNKKKIYHDDPLDVALFLEDNGITRLHLVDLDGARMGKVMHWKILEKIAKNTKLIIDFGGGIHTEEDINNVFNNGGKMVSIGSIAIKNPILLKEWINNYGSEKILLGVDVLNNKIAINGWTKIYNISILDFIKKKYTDGVKNIFCTDINKDGSLSGPTFSLYEKIKKNFFNIKLIASGGISKIRDVEKLLKLGCSGVIIGKAIYENKILFSEIINLKEKMDLC
ncbi:1-(5-phosphoribosyl)-5-[(5-phosphoribosylamino)methylideneamino]imidazole-4-carboxamide isomerase [Blattabacterium cuenoti]|uniref:1-(5-phosphoribosyl)-5-[(5- phosphoribosylamino)methylideneamino]imidazole-4- carboxamide isomerase n=1 Tax=Blattabacterium cuenoti TaxID=1653831 RepID=UPI00163D13BC|nr:1-(5-phosphoribosyl)-5-[(5-phosphoribosylamino)methylideneamino]imidazole-4-carboxamide isomerase [Blattabacterium cuenoti]